MRTCFFNELKTMMRADKRLFLLAADMGLGLVEPFQQEFPDRFINVGIAEQNMIGIGAGLCNAGFRPVCYTISNFLIQRSFEQIRNDLCLHNYPVILVGTSTGFDNGKLGPTHQVIDDIGCLKSLPQISIYSPTSVASVKPVFDEVMKNQNPAYIRIGKGSFDVDSPHPEVNQMVVTSDRSDILLVVHGNILENCVKAVQENPRFSLYAMNRLKPIDTNEISGLFRNYSKIVVVEDHLAGSGLYNTLCQCLAETRSCQTELYSIAVPDCYDPRVGDRNFFAEKYGYSPERINEMVSNLLSHCPV